MKKTTKQISRFLNFCDRVNLHFEIGFRPRNEGDGRFYVHFSPHNHLKVFNGMEMEDFYFVNGDTPSQALKNAEKYFKGRYVSVYHLNEKGSGWVTSTVLV